MEAPRPDTPMTVADAHKCDCCNRNTGHMRNLNVVIEPAYDGEPPEPFMVCHPCMDDRQVSI